MQPTILSNINLAVSDSERAYQFYAAVFGFGEEASMSNRPDFPVLNAGGCTLSFQPAEAVGMGDDARGGIELGFDVADVSATAELLQQQGGQIERRNQMDWGESVDARDLDGHRLTLYRKR